MSKVFAIDPGTQACGWALYEDGVLGPSGLITDEGDAFDRCSSIAKAIFYQVSFYQPDEVVSEYPHKGGVGMKSGHITVLYHFCGMLHAYMNHIDVPITFIQPMEWKGQVKKEIHHPKLIKKILADYGVDMKDYSPDTIDAVGIGYWWVKEKPLEKK